MSRGTQSQFDAVIVGSGPNGLAAAIVLARAGRSVLLVEKSEEVGGGVRSCEMTLPGFTHDICSAIHPMAIASPIFSTFPLASHGLDWIHPGVPLAHPFDDGSAAVLSTSVAETARGLGSDGPAYESLFGEWSENWEGLFHDILQPLFRFPRHPLRMARFGLQGLRSARGFAHSRFTEAKTQALIAGLGAHSMLPLEQRATAGIALSLAISAHARGWPMPKGGAGALSRALVSYFKELGGEVRTNFFVRNISDLPASRMVFFDLTPEPLLKIAGEKLSGAYRDRLEKFRGGPGVFKVDFALSSPIPWKAAECARAGTVHLGGTLEEIAASEQAPWDGRISEKPFVLLTQPTLFDASRAPPDKHVAWAYCHVPRGDTRDMSVAIEAQIERFAPGFRERILAKKLTFPSDFEARNPNLVGGDISGGVMDLRQIFFRPVAGPNPYRMPVKGWYLCSAATPPGSGVHGMCGFHAARCALKDGF